MNDLIKHLTYDERRELMLKEAREKKIRPTLLQKKYGISLGGKPLGSKSLRVQVWEELNHGILTEAANKCFKELMKLEGEPFLRHYNVLLSYFKPKAATEINLTLQNKFDIGFEENQEIIDIKINEEE